MFCTVLQLRWLLARSLTSVLDSRENELLLSKLNLLTVRVLTCPVLCTSLCEPFPVYLARGPLIHHFSGYK